MNCLFLIKMPCCSFVYGAVNGVAVLFTAVFVLLWAVFSTCTRFPVVQNDWLRPSQKRQQ
jgi:hypothetical protein